MQHPEYKRPLQFRNVYSFVPPTPNLQEIKRANMKIKTQKGQQNEMKIMTPRSTRNLHSEGQKKKSFRNLSLILDIDQEHNTNPTQSKMPTSNKLKDHPQNHSNHLPFSTVIPYEGKQNGGMDHCNLNMKKKSKQTNNIEFKEVKSTKNKLQSQQIQPKEPMHQKICSKNPFQSNGDGILKFQTFKSPQNNSHHDHVNGISYANDFESVTYQNHYKASTLTSFKQSLNGFQTYFSNVENQLQSEFTLKEQLFQTSIKQINEQFSRITIKLNQMHQKTLKDMAKSLMAMKTEYKANMKQLLDMQKSIIRYQSDISLNYEDIVRELDFKCFEEIMTQYGNKLEYFSEEVKWITYQKEEQPDILHHLGKLVKYIDKVEMEYESKMTGRESTFVRKWQPLLVKDQLTSRKVS